MKTRAMTIRCTAEEAEAIRNAHDIGNRYGTEWREFELKKQGILEAGRAAFKSACDRASEWHNRWVGASTAIEREAVEKLAAIEDSSMVTVRIGGGA
jgi:hypothetical protein